jgi:hypothetical protein
MKTFQEWLSKTHPEIVDEGMFGKWGQRAAVSGALLGAGMGVGRYMSQDKQKPNAQQPQIVNQAQTDTATQSTTPSDKQSWTAPSTNKNWTASSSDKNWNSELGDYTLSKDDQGRTVYSSEKGKFIKVPSKFNSTGIKFVRVQ